MARAISRKAAPINHPAAASGLGGGLAAHAVRLGAAWILAGAVAKAATGLPSELPSPILATDLDPVVVIVIGVFVEGLVGLVALAAPRVAAPAVAALLAFFSLLLVGHLAQGGESCGCFGGALPVPAGVLLGVDLAILTLVIGLSLRERLLTPSAWRAALGRTATLGLAGGLMAGLALAVLANGRLERVLSTGPDPLSPQAPERAPALGQASIVAPWSLPATIPEQVLLRPSEWVGTPLAQTALGTWTDTSVFPRTATLVFFYRSCSHCATVLRNLAEEQAFDPASAPNYVLVELPTPEGYKGRLFVDEVPEHALWIELPSVVKTYVMTPPWSVEVSDGIVRKAHRIPWPIERNAPMENTPERNAPPASPTAPPVNPRIPGS